MAKAAFLYLDGEEQDTQLIDVLSMSRPWLAKNDPQWPTEPAEEKTVRAILESSLAVDFRWLGAAEAVRDWPIGRAFGPQGELVWQREDGLTHVVLITDRDSLPPPFRVPAEAPEVETQPRTASIPLRRIAGNEELDEVQLWGEWQPDSTWRETRIPDPLSYPIEGEGRKKRVALSLGRYVETEQPDTGAVDFVRYVGLEFRSSEQARS